MYVVPVRLIAAFLLLLTSSCAAASFRAQQARERGDLCEFCKISADAAESDPRSQNDLGICHHEGYCGYVKNQELAVANYREAARWDIEEAKQNLLSLGIQPR